MADRCGSLTEAYREAERFIRPHLSSVRAYTNAPLGEVASYTDSRVRRTECGRFRIRSHIEQKNQFGAEERVPFEVKLGLREDGVWWVRFAEIDGRNLVR